MKGKNIVKRINCQCKEKKDGEAEKGGIRKGVLTIVIVKLKIKEFVDRFFTLRFLDFEYLLTFAIRFKHCCSFLYARINISDQSMPQIRIVLL